MCEKDSGSSIGLDARKEVDEVMQGDCWASHGTDVSVLHHELPLSYLCRSVFVRKNPSDSIESVVLVVTRESL